MNTVEGTAVPFFVKFTHVMILKELVSQEIESFLNDTEYYLVDINIDNTNRINIEVDSFEGVSIDFCAKLSKYIESKFDREADDYELQVSSAGLTEPFKVLKQYEKNIDNEVEVLTKDGKKISGFLISADENEFVVQIEKTEKPEGAKRKITTQEDLIFKYTDIKYTKYIIRFK
jgi:ribosome maturation factor RimP